MRRGMTLSSRCVAVVGAGPAGLACARFLRDKGHVPIVFETAASVGGVWGRNPLNTVVYPNLRTNIPTCVMQCQDLPFEDGLPSFVGKDAACAYFENYARHFDLMKLIRFNCSVLKVHLADDPEQWEVVYSNENREKQSLMVDAVAVANGHYEKEFWPDIPGLSTWLQAGNGRHVMHSKHYRSADDFAGKSVVVVGAKSSGADIAKELKHTVSCLYVVDSKCKAVESHGELTVVPRGVSLTRDGDLYSNGIKLVGLPVDVVICAAGYVYDFPFLDEKALGMSFVNQKRVLPVYQHIIHAKIPSLAFIGLPKNPCPLRLCEAQSMYLSAFWSGEIKTTEEERMQWVQQHLEVVSPRVQDYHTFSDDWGSAWQYIKDLVKRVPGVDFDKFSSELKVAEEVYAVSATKKPRLPWDEDTYRDWEYEVDWSGGTFQSFCKNKTRQSSSL